MKVLGPFALSHDDLHHTNEVGEICEVKLPRIAAARRHMVQQVLLPNGIQKNLQSPDRAFSPTASREYGDKLKDVDRKRKLNYLEPFTISHHIDFVLQRRQRHSQT